MTLAGKGAEGCAGAGHGVSGEAGPAGELTGAPPVTL